jgi:hypothetical protein
METGSPDFQHLVARDNGMRAPAAIPFKAVYPYRQRLADCFEMYPFYSSVRRGPRSKAASVTLPGAFSADCETAYYISLMAFVVNIHIVRKIPEIGVRGRGA